MMQVLVSQDLQCLTRAAFHKPPFDGHYPSALMRDARCKPDARRLSQWFPKTTRLRKSGWRAAATVASLAVRHRAGGLPATCVPKTYLLSTSVLYVIISLEPA